MPPANPQHEHQASELRLLFKHFLAFFVIVYIVRFLNGLILSTIGWSNPFVFAWGILILAHFIAFLMSLGVFGIEWEGRTSMEILVDLKEEYIDPKLKQLESYYKNFSKPSSKDNSK